MIGPEQAARFAAACRHVLTGDRAEMGIGTLGEKPMHLILKHYVCEDPDYHEVGLGTFFADAVWQGRVYEIQTGGFFPLKKKLAYYATRDDLRCEVVCPVIAKKRLIWVDPETGEERAGRRTSLPRAHMRVLREMIHLLPVLDFSHVSFRLCFLEAEEYKILDGRGADKKRRATRIECCPTAILDEVTLTSAADVAEIFLPKGLPDPFTSADFSRLTGAKRMALSADLKVLLHLGVIKKSPQKRGNALLYYVEQ